MYTSSIRMFLLVFPAAVFFVHSAPARSQEGHNHWLPDEFNSFVVKMQRDNNAFLVRDEARRADESAVEVKLLEAAIKNSAAWIHQVLKEEYVPDDLESRIEGIVGCYVHFYDGVPDKKAPYDCTRVVFESRGYTFLVMQDSAIISFLVAPVKFDEAAKALPLDELARRLQEQTRKIFRHGQASFYLRAIRVTDFGVESIDPYEAWYPADQRWKCTVIVPCRSWEDGVLPECGLSPRNPPREGPIPYEEAAARRIRVAEKLEAIDPTLTNESEQGSGYDQAWWGKVYAATDGRVLAYSAPKMSAGGQAVLPPFTPDWFRKSDSDNLGDGSLNKAGLPRERGANWPQ